MVDIKDKGFKISLLKMFEELRQDVEEVMIVMCEQMEI